MMRFSFVQSVLGVLLVSEVPGQTDVCKSIEAAISGSVYYPGTADYMHDISHWSQLSTQSSICSVEPGTPEDVGRILRILDTTRTPFAVKGGGHSTNPGFSATAGVQIAMYRFSELDYDAAAETVTVGTGMTWDDVYAQLEPYGVNVVGGRVPGPGVAGFSLGGGFSWLTNQYGLSLDTIVAMELVKPNGVVTNVTQDSDPELFFGLKGTQNNLGVVTRIVFKTFPQGQVWGGQIAYGADQVASVNAATVRFHKITDPKAEVVTGHTFTNGEVNAAVLLFYDAPTAPSGVFDDFLSIPAISRNVSTRSFKDHVASNTENFPSMSGLRVRTALHTVSLLDHSQSVVDAVANETAFWGSRFAAQVPGPFVVSYFMEPFLPDILSHNSEPTAYPPSREATLFPFAVQYAWSSSDMDEYFLDGMRLSVKQITAAAVADGQAIQDVALYPNYALYDTPPSRIFGDNLERLKALKARVDPHDVMGLAGGFKL
ncbi:FAD-binding domain-containing protein [Hymenopellis radicata]|nr:FAD-binding domain-containing protein [Hymenopellis radicata]